MGRSLDRCETLIKVREQRSNYCNHLSPTNVPKEHARIVRQRASISFKEGAGQINVTTECFHTWGSFADPSLFVRDGSSRCYIGTDIS